MLDAELVAFGIRHHDPSPGVGAPTIVHDAGAQVEEAGDLVSWLESFGNRSRYPILDRLLLGHGDEHQPRQAPTGRAHHPMVVARTSHQLLGRPVTAAQNRATARASRQFECGR